MSSHVVHNSSRCTDYYLNAFSECGYLSVDGLTSVNRKNLYIVLIFKELSEFFAYLYGKLSCRAENKCL